MRIKRFNESEQVDISSERIDEILNELRDFSSTMNDRLKFIESLLGEFEIFRGQSTKGNDQIDDSILSLQVIKKDIGNCIDKVDNVINNLVDYDNNGRKYLYSENK